MMSAQQYQMTDPSFHAEYLHFDDGAHHRVLRGEWPVIMDGFDWWTAVDNPRARGYVDWDAKAIVDGDSRARGRVTEIEATDDGYLLSVEVTDV